MNASCTTSSAVPTSRTSSTERRTRRRQWAAYNASSASSAVQEPSPIRRLGAVACAVTLVGRPVAAYGLPMADCLFCKIVAGEVPGEVVHTTERTVAFRDLDPQAPMHVLVVPKDH